MSDYDKIEGLKLAREIMLDYVEELAFNDVTEKRYDTIRANIHKRFEILASLCVDSIGDKK